MKNKKYLSITEHLNIVNTINHFKRLGITLFNEKNKLRFACGVALVGVGLITIPIPATTPPLIALGFVLMGYSKRDLLKKKNELKWNIKYRVKKRLKN